MIIIIYISAVLYHDIVISTYLQIFGFHWIIMPLILMVVIFVEMDLLWHHIKFKNKLTKGKEKDIDMW